MDPTTAALLSSWNWRPEVMLTLLALAALYGRGWRRLRRRRTSARRLANGWRLAAYLGGLLLVGLALMSPIDVLGGQLFYMHMIQHLLLVMLAPPLLLLANPFPLALWGLPAAPRRHVSGWFKPTAATRRALRQLTPPSVAWLVAAAFLVGWHDPNAYNLALREAWIHDLEHLTFFVSAVLFWWHVIGSGPRLHGHFSRLGRIAYLIAAVPVTMLTGIVIAFATEPIYSYYTTVPRLGGLSVMEDQILAGIIMWIPGSMMYLIAALILVARLVQNEEQKQPLPETAWATDSAMIAPGWDK